MRIVVVASLVLAALAVVVSCSDDKPPISSDTCTVNCTPSFASSGSGGDAGSCGYVVVAQPCNDCIRDQCCDFDLTCFHSPACGALVDCLNGCATGDVTCEQACGGSNDAGVGAYTDFVSCIQSTCQAQCTATD